MHKLPFNADLVCSAQSLEGPLKELLQSLPGKQTSMDELCIEDLGLMDTECAVAVVDWAVNSLRRMQVALEQSANILRVW